MLYLQLILDVYSVCFTETWTSGLWTLPPPDRLLPAKTICAIVSPPPPIGEPLYPTVSLCGALWLAERGPIDYPHHDIVMWGAWHPFLIACKALPRLCCVKAFLACLVRLVLMAFFMILSLSAPRHWKIHPCLINVTPPTSGTHTHTHTHTPELSLWCVWHSFSLDLWVWRSFTRVRMKTNPRTVHYAFHYKKRVLQNTVTTPLRTV